MDELSGQGQFKQKFNGRDIDDVQTDIYIFLTSFVPIQIIMYSEYLDGSKEVLYNDKTDRLKSLSYIRKVEKYFGNHTMIRKL